MGRHRPQRRQKFWNKTLPNDEVKPTKVYQELSAKGAVLAVVDQPATIGALAFAVAQNIGISVAFLPGLWMRRIAVIYPGTANTDEKDTLTIADVTLTVPHTVRSIHVTDEDKATRGMLTEFELDPTHQITLTRDRIRGLSAQNHPLQVRILAMWLENMTTCWKSSLLAHPSSLEACSDGRIDTNLERNGTRRNAAWA